MNKKALFAFVVIVFLGLGVKKMTIEPRGIRNKNPGNIRLTLTKWDGMSAVQKDGAFIQFIDEKYGIRALSKVLMNYQKRYGINTIRRVIARWAPATENNTAAYIASVAAHIGASPDAPLDLTRRAVLLPLVQAIIKHENGKQPYSIATINKSLDMAGVA